MDGHGLLNEELLLLYSSVREDKFMLDRIRTLRDVPAQIFVPHQRNDKIFVGQRKLHYLVESGSGTAVATKRRYCLREAFEEQLHNTSNNSNNMTKGPKNRRIYYMMIPQHIHAN